jgi:glycine C-acetyltransferase
MNEQRLRERGVESRLVAPGAGADHVAAVGDARTIYEPSILERFVHGDGIEHTEITGFNEQVEAAKAGGLYPFEAPRMRTLETRTEVLRETGERLSMLNFASYNYLGYGKHPAVIAAAKEALDIYGLGAASTPILSGTFGLHKELEERLVDFIGLPGYGVSLFSSGYGTNLGTISAFVKPGTYVLLDQLAHMSLLEGTILAKAQVRYFRHNDSEHLERLLRKIADGRSRILVCTEGIYSADGDAGCLSRIVEVAKRYRARVLVDEAHSMLLTGPNGRGMCEAQGVLDAVDLLVITFSKAFCGVGGALLARREITQYVNWFAKCRVFSCALDPAVTGGINKVLELAAGPDGAARRERLLTNAELMRSLLMGRVDIGAGRSWVIPIIFGTERLSMAISDYLQRAGLDAGVLQYPAAPRNKARIRLFVTSEHTHAQIREAAAIVLQAADAFGFRRP